MKKASKFGFGLMLLSMFLAIQTLIYVTFTGNIHSGFSAPYWLLFAVFMVGFYLYVFSD